jgi:hypothetical protein
MIWRAVASATNFSLSSRPDWEVSNNDKLKFVEHKRRRRFALPAHSKEKTL